MLYQEATCVIVFVAFYMPLLVIDLRQSRRLETCEPLKADW